MWFVFFILLKWYSKLIFTCQNNLAFPEWIPSVIVYNPFYVIEFHYLAFCWKFCVDMYKEYWSVALSYSVMSLVLLSNNFPLLCYFLGESVKDWHLFFIYLVNFISEFLTFCMKILMYLFLFVLELLGFSISSWVLDVCIFIEFGPFHLNT